MSMLDITLRYLSSARHFVLTRPIECSPGESLQVLILEEISLLLKYLLLGKYRTSYFVGIDREITAHQRQLIFMKLFNRPQ